MIERKIKSSRGIKKRKEKEGAGTKESKKEKKWKRKRKRKKERKKERKK